MSIGNKLGRAIGATGALLVEGSVRGASGLGRFGADVVAGAEEGYDEKRAALLITRAANEVKRKAAMEALKAAHEARMLEAPTEAVEPVVRATKRGSLKTA